MQNFDLLGDCNKGKAREIRAKKYWWDLNYELIKCSWNGSQILCGDQMLSSLISALNRTKFSLWDLDTVASRTHCNQNVKHVVKSPLNMFLVGNCAVSRHFRDNVWEEWAEISHIHLYLVLSPETKKATFSTCKLSGFQIIWYPWLLCSQTFLVGPVLLLGVVIVAAVIWDVVVRGLSCVSPLPWEVMTSGQR